MEFKHCGWKVQTWNIFETSLIYLETLLHIFLLSTNWGHRKDCDLKTNESLCILMTWDQLVTSMENILYVYRDLNTVSSDAI